MTQAIGCRYRSRDGYPRRPNTSQRKRKGPTSCILSNPNPPLALTQVRLRVYWRLEGITDTLVKTDRSQKMATQRRVFYSFHYRQDAWRAAQVRNMGVLEGNQPASDNDWEEIENGGAPAIKRWIDSQMKGRSCAVILIGSHTANRKWINYEIKRAWDINKGVVGIYIHNLEDENGEQSTKGKNPFTYVLIGGQPLSEIVKDYNPPFVISKKVYSYIHDNLANWVEEAIRIRGSK